MQFHQNKLSTFVAAALVCLSGSASAGGLAIITQSGSAVGNAFAGGASAAEDATTLWYNPAGMMNLQGTTLSVPIHAIKPSFKFQNTGSTGAFAAPGTGEGGDGGSLALVPQFYAAKRLNERWSIGIGINSPFGLKTEYDAGWRGQFVALKSEAKSYNVNPAVAYKVSDAVWLGGGINVQRFTTELTNFAGPAAGIARLEADDTAWGFNLGAMVNVSSSTRIGLSYRSQLSYRLEGTATFSGGGGALNSGAQADITVPENAAVSIFSRLSDKWDVMAGATWTHWNRLQTVSIVRTSPSALGGVGSLVSALPFSWSNTTFFAVGANYRPQENWLVRFGLGYDPAVSNDVTRTPRLPDQARVLVTAGGRYKLSNASALDFAYAHEFIRDASVNNTVTGVPGALVGKFNNQANVLSVQYNHTF